MNNGRQMSVARKIGFGAIAFGGLLVIVGVGGGSYGLLTSGGVIVVLGILVTGAGTPGGLLMATALPLMVVGLVALSTTVTTTTVDGFGESSSSTDTPGLAVGIPCFALGLIMIVIGKVLSTKGVRWPSGMVGAVSAHIAAAADRAQRSIQPGGPYPPGTPPDGLMQGGMSPGPGFAPQAPAYPPPSVPLSPSHPPSPPPPPAVLHVTAQVPPHELHDAVVSLIGARPTPSGPEPVIYQLENRPGLIQVAFGELARAPLFILDVRVTASATESAAEFAVTASTSAQPPAMGIVGGEVVDGLFDHVRRNLPLRCPSAIVG